MKEIDLQLLSQIVKIPGAPGFEEKIRNFLIAEIAPLVDDFYVDNIGNLVAVKKSKVENAPKLMLSAHMDEIGFIVTHIDEQGFLRFHTLGGFDPKTLTAQRVIVHGKKDLVGVMGSKPIHVMSPEERNAVPKIQDYFIDLGLSKAEVEEFISVGDAITRERELIELGHCVNAKSIDNRICVYILVELLKHLKGENLPIEVYAVFTVQEEMGARGAVTATHAINPDFALALDTTIAYDVPGAKPQEMVTKLGFGPAIKLLDSSVISDRRMVAFLKQVAENNSIKWQYEILTGGNTDAGPMQRSGKNGAIAGAISIPTRHIHQVIESAHKQDVVEAVNLLFESVKSFNSYNWAY